MKKTLDPITQIATISNLCVVAVGRPGTKPLARELISTLISDELAEHGLAMLDLVPHVPGCSTAILLEFKKVIEGAIDDIRTKEELDFLLDLATRFWEFWMASDEKHKPDHLDAFTARQGCLHAAAHRVVGSKIKTCLEKKHNLSGGAIGEMLGQLGGIMSMIAGGAEEAEKLALKVEGLLASGQFYEDRMWEYKCIQLDNDPSFYLVPDPDYKDQPAFGELAKTDDGEDDQEIWPEEFH